jgi:transposase
MPRPEGSSKDLEQRRRRAWRLLRSGAAPVQVATELKVSRRTVRRWRADGEQGRLAARISSGRPSRLKRGELLGLFTSGLTGAYHISWDTKLGEWVQRRPLDQFIRDLAAQKMRASRSAVYAWLSGRRWPGLTGIRLIAKSTRGQLTIDDVFDHFVVVSRRRLPFAAGYVAKVIHEVTGVHYHERHVRRLLRDLSGYFVHGRDHPGYAVTPDAIYKWIAGTREPSTLAAVQGLLRLSQGELGVSDIIEQRPLSRRASRR